MNSSFLAACSARSLAPCTHCFHALLSAGSVIACTLSGRQTKTRAAIAAGPRANRRPHAPPGLACACFVCYLHIWARVCGRQRCPTFPSLPLVVRCCEVTLELLRSMKGLQQSLWRRRQPRRRRPMFFKRARARGGRHFLLSPPFFSVTLRVGSMDWGLRRQRRSHKGLPYVDACFPPSPAAVRRRLPSAAVAVAVAVGLLARAIAANNKHSALDWGLAHGSMW